MKSSYSTGYALRICATMLLLAGCGESQTPIGPADATRQISAPAAQADLSKSWMLPEAQGKTTLLYTSLDRHRVGVFDYDTGKQVGSLSGFDDPYGGCVDA